MPLFPRLEHGDDRGVVRRVGVSEKIETTRGENLLHTGELLKIRFGTPHQLVCAFHGRAIGKIEDSEEVALVFVWNEPRRQFHKEAPGSEPESYEAGRTDQRATQKKPNPAKVAVCCLIEDF